MTDRKRERVSEKKNCACFLIMTESHYKVVPFLNKEIWFMYRHQPTVNYIKTLQCKANGNLQLG